jgi:hypothetical protein
MLLVISNLLSKDHIIPNYWQVVVKHVLLLLLAE